MVLSRPGMSRPPRLPILQYIGPFRCFLTLCSHRRVAVFRSAESVSRTLMEFLRVAEHERFAVLAYCFMPDHLHLLVEGRSSDSDLRLFVSAAKLRSERMHASVHGTRLWQEGYHQRVLRRAQDSRAIARYILEYPVRAGMVRTPLKYPYLGSAVWSVRELLDSACR